MRSRNDSFERDSTRLERLDPLATQPSHWRGEATRFFVSCKQVS